MGVLRKNTGCGTHNPQVFKQSSSQAIFHAKMHKKHEAATLKSLVQQPHYLFFAVSSLTPRSIILVPHVISDTNIL